MYIEPLLATWAADWNPLGAPVWLLFGAGSMAAFLVSRFSPLSVTVQHRLLLVLPGLMILGCLFTQWLRMASVTFLGQWYFYKFYYEHLDVAFIISFAFGAAFTLDLLRVKERRCQIVGWSVVPVYAGLLAVSLCYIYNWYLF